MNRIERTINTRHVEAEAKKHANLELPENMHERVIEAQIGPTIVLADDDREQRKHEQTLQHSREVKDEEGTVVAEASGTVLPNPGGIPPFVFLLAAAACALTDFAGSELTAYFSGVPAHQRLFVAASFTVGALLVTSGVAFAIESLWKRGITGQVGAVAAGLSYVLALLAVASSRFAPTDEDVSVLEVLGGALMTLFGVGGPAVGAHLALRSWLKARPAALAARRSRQSLRQAERDADRAHRALSGSQRAARERELERVRLRAVYLNAYRAEAALIALERKRTSNRNPEQEEN